MSMVLLSFFLVYVVGCLYLLFLLREEDPSQEERAAAHRRCYGGSARLRPVEKFFTLFVNNRLASLGFGGLRFSSYTTRLFS